MKKKIPQKLASLFSLHPRTFHNQLTVALKIWKRKIADYAVSEDPEQEASFRSEPFRKPETPIVEGN